MFGKLNLKFSSYMSLVKFSHTIFAMPFAIIGFFLAIKMNQVTFDPVKLLLVLGCVIFARNAAMAFNRYVDRDIDSKNPRTMLREIPSGIINAKSAMFFVIVNSLLFIGCTYLINTVTFYLSVVALAVVLGYSLTKHFTALCHLFLGLGLSLSPMGAYLAVTGEFHLTPILLSFIVLFWVSGFDIIYAMQDEEFDKKEKLKSIPTFLGKRNALAVSAILHIITAVLVVLCGTINNWGIIYWIGASLFIGMLAYQHFLVKPNDLSKVNLAFFTTNGIASIVYALFTNISFLPHDIFLIN